MKKASEIKEGDKFGGWTVIGPFEKHGDNYMYPCRCVCKKEKLVDGRSLVRGISNSCGCLSRRKPKDLTGFRNGRWLVVKRLGPNLYQCRCECGTERERTTEQIKQKRATSCGCLKKEISRKSIKYADEFRSAKKDLEYVKGTSIGNLKEKVSKNSTTGYKGVSPLKGKYRAYITLGRVQYHLGIYDSLNEAYRVRSEAEKILFTPIIESIENNAELQNLYKKKAEEIKNKYKK